MRKLTLLGIALVTLTIVVVGMAGCAGCSRDISSGLASNFGSDWMVVQLRFDGSPAYCWRLRDTAITNESQTDGIYWKDPSGSHLVHISGWYNRVQVMNGEWGQAAKLLGVDADKCGDGVYPAPAK